jgi:hypothetical protein
MNRLKFMDAPVDEAVHAEAHTPTGAQRMAGEAGFNWAYLMYDWGFPPEVEEEDWEDFRRAVEVYHAAGIKSFGYIQTSNCAYASSYQDRDWYALDPRGRYFHYYTGRFMTCPSHPEWLEHLREMVRGVVESGADGVFFDNPWHAIQPFDLGGAWLGPAGCYCDRCRAAFRQASGLEIPEGLDPEGDRASQEYIRWRTAQIAGTLGMLGEYARSLKPDAVVSANNFDAVMRPSYLVYGIDLQAMACVQDVVMIEDFGLPRWEGGSADLSSDGRSRPELINNALTLRTARALIGNTPLSTDPYDQGIGFDGVYPVRRFRQAIAEAAACGATMVVKGTEYVDDGVFTLLTAEKYTPERAAIGQIHGWLAEHAGLYQGRENAATVGLLYPGDAFWQAWDCLAPLYFGAGQTLLGAGVPWRVVLGDDDLTGLEVLLMFGATLADDRLPDGVRVIPVAELPGWEVAGPSFLARHKWARSLVAGPVGWLFQSYFRWHWARQLGDGLGLTQLFIHSPSFRLPLPGARATLLEAVGDKSYPRVRSGEPVLVELWRRGVEYQLHLVNYATEPQRVTVEFSGPVRGRLLSPDGADERHHGSQLDVLLDVYAVVEYEAENRKEATRSQP